jgi:hypothetical protein
MPRTAMLSLSMLMVALLAIVVYAGRREMTQPSGANSVVASAAASPQPRPLSPEEEAYAIALWPTHNEFVEAAAVRLAFAGLVYATEDHDARKLAAAIQPVGVTFHTAHDKVRALDVPASLQRIHEQYLDVLTLYERASAEMLKVAADGNERHLIDAQELSHRAAQELIKAGDVLWPGEHKPN